MSEKREQPHEGGSYVRQKDGTLRRAGEAPPATAPAPAEPAPAAKPVAKSIAKRAKE